MCWKVYRKARKDIFGPWQLHHNTPYQNARVCELLIKHQMWTLPQPRYSLDIAPEDFPGIKKDLKVHRGDPISRNEDIARSPRRRLPERVPIMVETLKKCVVVQEQYFEEF